MSQHSLSLSLRFALLPCAINQIQGLYQDPHHVPSQLRAGFLEP